MQLGGHLSTFLVARKPLDLEEEFNIFINSIIPIDL